MLLEGELKGRSAASILDGLPPPKLGLNCVGGRSSLGLAKLLGVKVRSGCLCCLVALLDGRAVGKRWFS